MINNRFVLFDLILHNELSFIIELIKTGIELNPMVSSMDNKSKKITQIVNKIKYFIFRLFFIFKKSFINQN